MGIPKALKKKKLSPEERIENAVTKANGTEKASVELKPESKVVPKTTKTEKAAGKKTVGRPKKSEEEVLSEKILVSLTKDERAKLDKKANVSPGIVVPLPALIRGLLKENNII